MELQPSARRIGCLRASVLAWYQRHGRRFAFRGPRDPYRVLVAEVILQQTQASRGEAAWGGFLARFPDVATLAAARPAEVLRAWAGLGYNRRALNLHRAARAVVAEHGGRVPEGIGELQRLPGVGPYTARAVAAIAHSSLIGERQGLVETLRRGAAQLLADADKAPMMIAKGKLPLRGSRVRGKAQRKAIFRRAAGGNS